MPLPEKHADHRPDLSAFGKDWLPGKGEAAGRPTNDTGRSNVCQGGPSPLAREVLGVIKKSGSVDASAWRTDVADGDMFTISEDGEVAVLLFVGCSEGFERLSTDATIRYSHFVINSVRLILAASIGQSKALRAMSLTSGFAVGPKLEDCL